MLCRLIVLVQLVIGQPNGLFTTFSLNKTLSLFTILILNGNKYNYNNILNLSLFIFNFKET